MEIPLFLSMTAAEFRGAEVLPEHPAWMACHFSSYGTGISNIPKALPPGAMLMLNDRTPIYEHDPQTVARELCEAAVSLKCDSILLDFQREGYVQLHDVIEAVLTNAPCPVGVSSLYAAGFDCPVLMPPIPPHSPPGEAVAPWQGRELWQEMSSEGTAIRITESGSQYTSLPCYHPEGTIHKEKELYCHYEITVEEDNILFRLGRTQEDQLSLLSTLKSMGCTCAVGLWQEIKR